MRNHYGINSEQLSPDEALLAIILKSAFDAADEGDPEARAFVCDIVSLDSLRWLYQLNCINWDPATAPIQPVLMEV